MSAYRSGDRIVLVPCFKETAPFPIWVEDVESLAVAGTGVSDTDLGSLAIELLRNQRPREFEKVMRGPEYQRRTAARRRALCKGIRREDSRGVAGRLQESPRGQPVVMK